MCCSAAGTLLAVLLCWCCHSSNPTTPPLVCSDTLPYSYIKTVVINPCAVNVRVLWLFVCCAVCRDVPCFQYAAFSIVPVMNPPAHMLGIVAMLGKRDALLFMALCRAGNHCTIAAMLARLESVQVLCSVPANLAGSAAFDSHGVCDSIAGYEKLWVYASRVFCPHVTLLVATIACARPSVLMACAVHTFGVAS